MKNADSIANDIISLLESNAQPKNAGPMEAYMQHHFKFYGIKSQERRDLLADYWNWHRDDIKNRFRDICKLLWAEDKRECQYVAMDFLSKYQKDLGQSDLSMIEAFIVTRSWWDTVDFLAANPVGLILKNDIELRHFKAAEYIGSDNMWLQRTALIFQLKYKDNTDELLLFETIRSLLGSKEFFINKAIGWALRQYSKTNPHAVRDFLREHRERMASLSVREAAKYI